MDPNDVGAVGPTSFPRPSSLFFCEGKKHVWIVEGRRYEARRNHVQGSNMGWFGGGNEERSGSGPMGNYSGELGEGTGDAFDGSSSFGSDGEGAWMGGTNEVNEAKLKRTKTNQRKEEDVRLETKPENVQAWRLTRIATTNACKKRSTKHTCM